VVNLPGAPDWIGRTVPVTIRRAGPNSLWGEIQQVKQVQQVDRVDRVDQIGRVDQVGRVHLGRT
jgi:hypothetical protein